MELTGSLVTQLVSYGSAFRSNTTIMQEDPTNDCPRMLVQVDSACRQLSNGGNDGEDVGGLRESRLTDAICQAGIQAALAAHIRSNHGLKCVYAQCIICSRDEMALKTSEGVVTTPDFLICIVTHVCPPCCRGTKKRDHTGPA